jgi:uncharacterized membrane protein YvbJ
MNQSVNCPYCGGEISLKAKACPHCGSDENTGWSPERYLDGIDLPDEDDTYQEIKEREFGSGKTVLSWKTITGFVLLILILMLVVKTVAGW